jgi:hypothetical protein
MNNRSLGVVLTLVAGVSAVHADPLKHSLLDGVFKPAPDALGEGTVHPLPPAQRLQALTKGGFAIVLEEKGQPQIFPVLARPDGEAGADLKLLEGEEPAFIAPVDLTGTGASDLIYATRSMKGWGVLSNGARLPKPVHGFVAGYFPKGAAAPKADLIPSDNQDLIVDQDLLAAVGDFLGNGTEQLAYTRPGFSTIYVVGAHGVTTMRSDLTKIQPSTPGGGSHWLFPYKATRSGQRTRLAYYRQGADHLVPHGMDFVSEGVPLKGHWERLSQNVLDWPTPATAAASAPAAAAPAPAASAPLAQDEKSAPAK